MDKKAFYSGIVKKQRDARRVAMGLAHLHAAVGAPRAVQEAHIQRAVRLMVPLVTHKRDHVAAARQANRELVRNARVLKRIPDGS